MKKTILFLSMLLILGGCDSVNPDEIIRKAGNPFKEYTIPDTKLAKEVEEVILSTEANEKGLDLSQSSAHLISFTKIGTYGKVK